MTRIRTTLLVMSIALGMLSIPAAAQNSVARPTGGDGAARGVEEPGEPAPDFVADPEGDWDRDEGEFDDQQILDDLIVDGSICGGFDCVNGESFGFDTLRLKENNLRIKFQDTSNSASFPSNDWQITINETTNGGANKFSIDDIDGGRTPFTIEASAPSHSLYVDDGGRVGFGTSTPVVDLHVKSGNTPTLRLEQDGSSGFTAQTWDVAANETNFFVRDATNGSRLPLRIRPNAPSNSIYVDTDSDVGLGTSNPDFDLDVSRSGQVGFALTDTAGDQWVLLNDATGQASEGVSFTRAGSGSREFRIGPTGTIVLPDSAQQPGTNYEGGIYYDGDTFCGYDGTQWLPLHAGGDQTCD